MIYWDLESVLYIQNQLGCILWVLKELKMNLAILFLCSTGFSIYWGKNEILLCMGI